MNSELHDNAANGRRGDAPEPVVAFDMFGTLHQLPGTWAGQRDVTERTVEAEAPTQRSRGLRGWRAAFAVAAMGLAVTTVAHGALADTLLNVSYDPTRELYKAYDAAFAEHWKAEGHANLDIKTSHSGSGAQARSVIDGLDAQVVTLALASDVDAIAKKTGKIPADWQTKLPHNSAPYTSTIVFLVRAGNPKGIKDWGDLVKDGVQVVTPNPKTSGGARWNYLAAWAWANKQFGGNQDQIRDYMHALFANVPVLDTGARGSTTTFAQRGIGDVLLSWENEAYLAKQELGADKFDIVYPSISVLAEPTVAVVDGNLHTPDQTAAATEYLTWLYSPEAQAIALKNFYRAWDTSKADPADVARFPKLELATIADFGGWAKAQPEHFGDGGIFDQIYHAK